MPQQRRREPNESLFGNQITSIALNEQFSNPGCASPVENFCPDQTNNWGKPTPYGIASYNQSGYWYDQIYFYCSDSGTTCVNPNVSPPQNQLSGSTVDHSKQTWRVGSATVGSGVEVQYDTFQRYVDHGRHTMLSAQCNS